MSAITRIRGSESHGLVTSKSVELEHGRLATLKVVEMRPEEMADCHTSDAIAEYQEGKLIRSGQLAQLAKADPVLFESLAGKPFYLGDEPGALPESLCRIDRKAGKIEPVSPIEWNHRLDFDEKVVSHGGNQRMSAIIGRKGFTDRILDISGNYRADYLAPIVVVVQEAHADTNKAAAAAKRG